MAVIPPPNEQWELFSDTPVSYRDGRDELNLAEFPISTIGNRADPNIKTISFEDQAVDKDTGESIYRQLTITASDKYGLPTATDDEVLLGLLQISRWQRFASQTVAFTPYQLIKLLGWSISTNNYRRLRDSIERWLGVTLHYVNAWRDKQTGHWIDAGFHFIEFVKFYKPGEHSNVLAPEGLSVIRWNELVFRNLREGNLKTLDFHLYRTLKSGIAKRMLRFLDKRFYYRRRLTFELETFACEKIGLTRPTKRSATNKITTDVAQLKRRLLPAIRELEQSGFIVARPLRQRFTKELNGWQVGFERGSIVEAAEASEASEAQPALALDVSAVSPLEGRLVGHGVSLAQARRMALEHPPERIEAQLEALEYLLTKGEKFQPENRAGWLVKAVTENYGSPRGFKTHTQREEEKRQKMLKTQRRSEAENKNEARAAQEKTQAQAEALRVQAYLDKLPAEERQVVEAAALKASVLGRGRVSVAVRQGLLYQHVLTLLQPLSKSA